MSTKCTLAFSLLLLLVSNGLRPQTAFAQGASGNSLAEQLRVQYKLAKIVPDSNGFSVAEPGTMLVVQKAGLLGVPIRTNLVEPFVFAIQKDSDLHHSAAPAGSWKFEVGHKVYVTKLDIDTKNDKVVFLIVECDCSDPGSPAFYKSRVEFDFPGGYLAGAEAGQIENVVGQVLAIPEAAQPEALPDPPPPDTSNTNRPVAPSCGSYDACMRIAQTLLESAQSDRALARFQDASQLDESRGDPWAGMGRAYFQMGQFDDAIGMFDKALQLGSTLSIGVCHAKALCGDTGNFLLSIKEVSFINKKGEKEFAAPPSAVTSEAAGVFNNGQAYFLQLHLAGKN